MRGWQSVSFCKVVIANRCGVHASVFVFLFSGCFLSDWLGWESIVGSGWSLSHLSAPAHWLGKGWVIVSTGLGTELKDAKDGAHGFSNLVDGTIVGTVDGFERLDHALDVVESNGGFLLLFLEQIDQSFDLVEGAFPLDTICGSLKNTVGLSVRHQIKSSRRNLCRTNMPMNTT